MTETPPLPEPPEEEKLEEEPVLDLAGRVREPTVDGLPDGYEYGVTRYADIILREAFPARFDNIVTSLAGFRPTLLELRTGGGGRTVFVKRFDESLSDQTEAGVTVWGKRNVTIEKGLGFDGDTKPVSKVRGHEIDMFGLGTLTEPLPGVAVEMEWNNKDPFFDRDLLNFQALHHEAAISVGVIVTRGPSLQALISGVIRSKDGGLKYGSSTTHWNKLVSRVNLGGGGECPLLLVGIEPERIEGVDAVYPVRALLDAAAEETRKDHWRTVYDSYANAQAAARKLKEEAYRLFPPLAEVPSEDDD